MIEQVFMERTTFAPPPQRFEAGTPPISQAVGLQAAVRYLSDLDMRAVAAHEHALTAYLLARLEDLGGVQVMARANLLIEGERSASLSMGCIRTTLARCSTIGESRFELAITAHGRCAAGTTCPPPRGPVSTSITEPMISTRWSTASGQRNSSLGCSMKLEQMYQEIILDHYRAPQNRGLREPFESEVHHVNPTCGESK